MTISPAARARLEEVMARSIYESHKFKKHWHHKDTIALWHLVCRSEARAAIDAALAAGFVISKPDDGP